MPYPAQTTNLPIGNAGAPIAQCPVDPVTGAVTVGGVVNYTAISTAGTTTVKPTPGVFFGLTFNNVGTGFLATAYDIAPYYTTTQGTLTTTNYTTFGGGTATLTNTLIATTTATAAGQQATPAPGVGVRTYGGLFLVTAGTPGQANVFWD